MAKTPLRSQTILSASTNFVIVATKLVTKSQTAQIREQKEENLWSVCSYLHGNIFARTRISNEAESRASLVTARAILVNKTVLVGTRLRVFFLLFASGFSQ